MANYEARFRTNYFKVKDPEAFRAWVKSLSEGDGTIDVFDGVEGALGLGGFCSVPSDRIATADEVRTYSARHADTMTSWLEPDAGITYEELFDDQIDFDQELATHLADGEVAVVQEVGWEKLRYLTGYAYAINHKGEVISRANIDDLKLPEGTSSVTY